MGNVGLDESSVCNRAFLVAFLKYTDNVALQCTACTLACLSKQFRH